jgi:hypothetical protein
MQFIGAGFVVVSGEGFGVSEDSQAFQSDAFNEAGAFDVESGDDTDHGHKTRASLPNESECGVEPENVVSGRAIPLHGGG